LDRYASNAALAERYGELPYNAFVSGGICLFRRDALLSIGGFRPDLGMRGARIAYGEETHVQVLLRRSGYRIGFEPGWRVEHYTPLAKQSLRWILRSAYGRGRDSWRAFDDLVSLGGMVKLVRKLITRPLGQVGRSFGDREFWRSWRNPALAVLEPLALTIGQLAGGFQTWRERK
jgi:GT2 family glycosyltransferase